MRATPVPQQPTICAPACETCGLLECLCRPRFFAGQLLTDTDLNRLDAYIRAKNRMHNLQLHGWGVVNGLQVRCDACGTGVIVGTGYAIDPCGEDIVVCKDSPVDICSLIKRCQPQDITCVPSSRNNGQSNCDDVEEDWVLAIRYTETQARTITALRSSPNCGCAAKGSSCSCGGSCGCGCGAKMTSTAPTNAMTATTAQRPRNPPAECEATAICEGYSWDAFLAPTEIPPRDGQTQLSGGLIDAINCCIEPFMASLPQRPTTPIDQNRDQWYLWCCRMKAALIAFFTSGPQANCTAVTTLQSIECPSTDDQAFESKINAAATLYVELELEALFACLCAALLPPAPCGTSDDRVPLAIVTVRKKDCKVLRVCNWTHLRRLVVTWPTLEYWFGWIPWFKTLQDSIAKFCCADFAFRREVVGVAGTNVASPDVAYMKVNPEVDPQLAKENQTMSALLASAFTRGNAAVDPAAILGLQSKAPLADVEKANLAPFLLLNQLARPVVTSAVSSDLQARVAVLEKMVGDMAKKKGGK
ncbi:MAG: hypothetical protein ABI467_21550 [Kofleriaceae bacterium]